MQKFVVTGSAGFIGSQIVERLLKDGIAASDVLAVDTSKELFRDHACSKHFSTLGVECVDHKTFLKAYSDAEATPSVIFHMGACSSTDETRQDYLDEHNLNYSKALWALAVKKQTKFIYASSAATYGSGGDGFEDDPSKISKLQPLNLYGWSKQNFDRFVLDELKAGCHPAVWAGLKFFNVYGPGESHKGGQASVVFHARGQIVSTGKLKLFQSHKPGILDGEQKRDFVFIDDCVEVALSVAQGWVKPGIYNVGSGQARSFLDLGRAVFKELHKVEKIEFVPTPERLREHYQYYTCATLENLRKAGFRKPMHTLEEGVAQYMKRWKE